MALIAGWLRNRHLQRKLERGEIKEMPKIRKARADGCCGQHETCERESLLAAVSKDIEYYDDEYLDTYRGRESDEYSDEEIEQFEDVLTTMHEDDVAGPGALAATARHQPAGCTERPSVPDCRRTPPLISPHGFSLFKFPQNFADTAAKLRPIA